MALTHIYLGTPAIWCVEKTHQIERVGLNVSLWGLFAFIFVKNMINAFRLHCLGLLLEHKFSTIVSLNNASV